MSDRDGSTFATTPVAPGGGRRPVLVASLVVAVVAGSFAIARLAPDPGPGQASETVRPTATFARVEPIATALPLREWFSAPEAPIEDVLVEAGSVRRLRLASAQLAGQALARPGRDLLLRGARRGTTCLCWQPAGLGSGDRWELDLVARDGDLREVSRRPLTVVVDVPGVDRPSGPTHVALEPSPDGRLAYLVRTVRSATRWRTSLDVIDLGTASIVDTVELMSVDRDDRMDVVAVAPPLLRVAPDGRHAVVMSAIERDVTGGLATVASHAWVVDLDGSALGRPFAVDAIVDALPDGPTGSCSWIAFAGPGIVAEGCRTSTSDRGTAFEIRRFDLRGRALGRISGGRLQPDPDTVLVDTLAGVAYAWDPVGHTLFAADLVGGGWRSAGPPPDGGDNPADIRLEADRPSIGPSTTWSDGRSATAMPMDRALAGSPDGRILFAIGTGSRPGSSSGIWVFDTQTLRLLERWPALAAYGSVTLFEGGRWLAAVGRPGVTAAGGPADWGTTMTIHDTSSGRPVLRIGDLHTDATVTFPRSGPLAATP